MSFRKLLVLFYPLLSFVFCRLDQEHDNYQPGPPYFNVLHIVVCDPILLLVGIKFIVLRVYDVLLTLEDHLLQRGGMGDPCPSLGMVPIVMSLGGSSFRCMCSRVNEERDLMIGSSS